MNKQYAQMLQLIGGSIINISKVISPKINKGGLVLNKQEYMDNITECIISGYNTIININNSKILDSEFFILLSAYRKLLVCLEDLLQKIESTITNIKIQDLSKSFSNIREIESDLNLAIIQIMNKKLSENWS
ncbi:hypothetical protein ACUXCC_005405 [Cytobacillus horneckiae]|uniref:hypothetical protein n=1 Tax=Cytobacillus horneckiae TaxID=549687 RepID=UPI0019D28686|nr:hypothetical protein [Cytobacillus horneckiae]MBN6887451.1 hypothetical protein [Cytobacillus horneckiae]